MATAEANGLCQACGQQIIWAKSAQGGRISLEPVPVIDGKYRLEVQEGRLVAVYGSTEALLDPEDLYNTHLPYCPRVVSKHGV